MRVLKQSEVAAVSGGAPSPLLIGGIALLNGVFTVANLVISLPALLAYRN